MLRECLQAAFCKTETNETLRRLAEGGETARGTGWCGRERMQNGIFRKCRGESALRNERQKAASVSIYILYRTRYNQNVTDKKVGIPCNMDILTIKTGNM